MRAATRTILLLALVAVLAGSGGADAGTKGGGSGILRIGTLSYIDSLNPFNYVEAQSFNAMIMVYPQLVQYVHGNRGYTAEGDWAKSWKRSQNGKDWTFALRPGTKWSDGKPLTAGDAAWTINTILKYATGPTAVAAPALGHVKSAAAPNATTLVIHYVRPVANVLAQLEQLFIVPRHVWEPLVGKDGAGLKTYHPEQRLPMVSAGAYTVKKYEKKGTTVFILDKNYWGPPSNAAAIALTYYTNPDSMIADLKQNNLDFVDQVPFNAIRVLSSAKGIEVVEIPGAETTNITWNSNPRKTRNRELLDPRVKRALSMCVNRDQVISVVFQGHATKVESLVGHISYLENPNLGPLTYDCAAGNHALDKLGYKRGANGIRMVPASKGKNAQRAHPMAYEVMTSTSTDFNVNREFQIVREGFAQAGVTVTQKVGGDTTSSYALESGPKCDLGKNTGYTGIDIAMWDWVGYVDPDFMLSVVTKSSWCSWSDTGWDNPAYDKLYEQQGTAVDAPTRKAIVWKMQKMIYDNVIYTQLVEEKQIDAHSRKWTAFQPWLNAYSKVYYTSPRKA